MRRALLAALVIHATASTLRAQAVSIQDFVRAVHYHGVPYDEARRYPASQVPVLLRLLADPAESPHWVKVVAVLGMIGDETVAGPLIAFAGQGSGMLTPDEYRAKATVLLALGYLANHTRSRVALDYLLASASAEGWNARGLRWSSPFHATVAERNARLSSTAWLGLALSGAPEAGELLRALPDQEVYREFQTIVRLGLSRYYARSKPLR